jgi:hypothetical protein|tara:strand:+ start:3962 stop:4810 length:849 start_codon:yes stop_codon:yes gene_type:complete
MAQPSTRQGLIDYCLRRLGAPVLEVNVADEQIDDLVDDALQFFHERHFDGVEKTYLRYKITQNDIDRGRTPGGSTNAGIVTTTASATIDGGTTTFSFEENSNYLQIPPAVIGVNSIFHFDGSNTVTNNMFSVKYQLFLNDIAFNLGYNGLLSYYMARTYLEDIEHLLTTDKQLRFNQRQDRLYIDIDWGSVSVDDYLILEVWRILDPNDFSRVYNDSFLKLYLTALIKKQWGQNLIKFQGVQLPGGIELNGRQIFDDAQREIDQIMDKMSSTYELPPLDLIG